MQKQPFTSVLLFRIAVLRNFINSQGRNCDQIFFKQPWLATLLNREFWRNFFSQDFEKFVKTALSVAACEKLKIFIFTFIRFHGKENIRLQPLSLITLVPWRELFVIIRNLEKPSKNKAMFVWLYPFYQPNT